MTKILPKIDGQPIIEGLINLHRLISGNAESVPSNLVGGQCGNLALTMTAKEYRSQKGFTVVTQQNQGEYLQIMGSAKEKVLRTEKF